MDKQKIPTADNETLFDDVANKIDKAQGQKELEAVEKVLKRKIVRQPRPKLDGDRLNSERGLQALHDQFKTLRFKKTKGYANRLTTILRIYEHWAHRLYPKLPFADVVEKIEHLGSKRTVQGILLSIRSGQNNQFDCPPYDIYDNINDDVLLLNRDKSEIQHQQRTNLHEPWPTDDKLNSPPSSENDANKENESREVLDSDVINYN